MQITRHNYENFFLLYVDNELSAADRKAVDVFVQANPDLRIELEALQQTVVKADDIILDKKDWLYREEEITALQESLLLYADDELTAAEKQPVELLLATDETAKNEWSILSKTKLKPDMAVVFPDKKLLYRHEGGRVVGFNWRRVAAAAVLLGIVTWVGVSVYKNKFITPVKNEVLAGNSKEHTLPSQKETTTANNSSAKNTGEQNDETKEMIVANVQKNTITLSTGNDNTNVKTVEHKNYQPANESMMAQVKEKNKNDNNLPKPNFENINNTGSNQSITANVTPVNNYASRVSGNNAAVVRKTAEEGITGSIASNDNRNNTPPNIIAVANKETNNEATGNSYLDVDNDKSKRTSLGGFLRKAKRIIERTTKVNTGDGIKVAGFEIALK
ncbi:MAG: hypothetical protein KDC15_04575 [Chitinophagaceae bacterium]|nr:hypothetical protein [Chitinophagaceae bacterium]